MDPPSTPSAPSISERLNQECFCITLDRDALCQALEREVGDPDFCATGGLRSSPNSLGEEIVEPSEDSAADRPADKSPS